MRTDLALWEERVERGFFRDWREAGDALEQIRDNSLYQPEYANFREYVEKRYGIHRATAYSYIHAAAVARDLSSRDDTLNLPQRHAAILFRFDADTRYEVAKEIQFLSFRHAMHAVLERAEEEPSERGKGPEHERDRLLRALSDAVRTIRHLVDETDLLGRITGLRPDARANLDRKLTAAIKRLLIAKGSEGSEESHVPNREDDLRDHRDGADEDADDGVEEIAERPHHSAEDAMGSAREWLERDNDPNDAQ